MGAQVLAEVGYCGCHQSTRRTLCTGSSSTCTPCSARSVFPWRTGESWKTRRTRWCLISVLTLIVNYQEEEVRGEPQQTFSFTVHRGLCKGTNGFRRSFFPPPPLSNIFTYQGECHAHDNRGENEVERGNLQEVAV